jgi:uncharacterized membrane protein
MTTTQFLKVYAASLVVCLGLDLLWLGVFAKAFYARQMGHLLRPDVQWLPAVLFYLVYVAAMIVFVVQPAVDRGSLPRAVILGAFFGIAAYSAFDLTSLALLKDFPVTIAAVDLAWGATLSASVCGAGYWVSRAISA